MKKLAALTLSLFLISGTAIADSPKDADAQPAKLAQPAKPRAAKNAEKADATFAAELEELRQALQAQQEQLQMLKEELAKRDRQIDEAREAAAAANSRAAEASSKAIEAVNSTAEVKSTAASLNATVGDLKASNEALKTAVATEQTQVSKATEEGPASIRYKGIAITPGGFVAAETVFRQRATGSDINTPFNGIPYPGNALSKVAENSFTARQSRLSLLAESKMGSAKLTGYYEADWLGTGVTSNNRQSNSYVFRQRILYGQAAFDNGWIVTGGQQWSLATETRTGITNRQEVLPMTIDSQYQVGFTWERQYGFRVVKDFGGKFALGFAVEGPQATIGGRGFSLATTTTVGTASVATTGNTFLNSPGNGGGLYNFSDTTGYSVNKAPDILIKAAADPGYGHYELFGIISTFRNRAYPCGVVGTNAKDTAPPALAKLVTLACSVDGSTTPSSIGAFNDARTGGGLGGNLRLPLFAKKLEFAAQGAAGDGIGRYGSAQLADLTFRPDGTQALIRTAHGLGELVYHVTPKLDIYADFGAEYVWRAAYQGYDSITITKTPALSAVPASGSFAGSPAIGATTTTAFKLNQIGGYGSPFANNSGCNTENPPSNQLTPSGGGTCAGDTRVIMEGTLGFWHKLYQGPKGGLRWGLQYSYFTKSGWSGNNGVATAVGISPKAIDNMIWTSFRYYIP
ncbi:MAG: hypothetical protein ACHQLQ_02625 [Candidatus Acidiferrales bacterium]